MGVINTEKIKKLQTEIDDLYIIGYFASNIEFYLDALGVLKESLPKDNGSVVFVLNKNASEKEEAILKGFFNIIKKEVKSKRDRLVIDWIYRNGVITHAYADWNSGQKLSNGHKGENVKSEHDREDEKVYDRH